MKRIFKFLSDWNGLITVPLALAVWFISPILLRWLDPTAGCFDAGVLQVLLFSVIGLLVGDFMAWLLIQLAWPLLNQYIDGLKFGSDWVRMPPQHRVICIIAIFGLHLLAFVLLCRVF